ncbi:MAG TPA: methyltransferase domain-containing protein [Candidatus Polarisedimenticolia bacterium]|nr:methyltransferase domain-containing protein [Candidatus Polarisedimenticolia bacterium]
MATPQRSSSTRLFLKQAREEFFHVGAIAPSSRFLARAVTRGIPGGPVSLLEAGAGTGALTLEIVRRLPPGSRLTIYEINGDFARHLRERFAREGGGNGRVGQGITVHVHHGDVQDLPPGPRYDGIVSGLPLNNFPPALVRRILESLFAALRPGGVLTYFEYLLIREIKSLTTGRRERRRLRRVGKVTAGFLDRYEFRREAVFLNIPPAVVHHLRKPGGG